MGGLRHLTEAGERVFRIQKRFNIGRDLQNDLVLSDQVVSNWHTSVEEDEDGFAVVDHNSLNGTYVQRGGAEPTRVQQRQPLQGGDVIRVGSARLVFETAIQLTPSPAPTPASSAPVERDAVDRTSAFPPTQVGRVLPVFFGGQAAEAPHDHEESPSATGHDGVLERLKALEERVGRLETALNRPGRAD
jgi:pSer/pThr/pTyr-binding forkhead associated (FHA) protein